MVNEIGSKKKLSWRSKAVICTAVPFFAAAFYFGPRIIFSINKFKEEREVMRTLKYPEFEFSREEFGVYYKLGLNSPWEVESFVIAGINTKILEVLVNDPEINDEARKEFKGDDGKLREKIIDKIGDLMRDAEYPVDWDYYLGMRSEEKGGFYSMISAKSYGLSLENMLKIPVPNKRDLDLLKKQRIPVDYAVPRLQQGKKVEDIAEGYSKTLGVTNDVREEYWKNRGKASLNDSQIEIFAANGINPIYFNDIASKGNYAVNRAIGLIQQGKLNGAIFDKWRPEVSIDEMFFGIQHGYSPDDAIRANRLGRTLMQYDTDLRYYDLLKSDPRNTTPQPILNGAPK